MMQKTDAQTEADPVSYKPWMRRGISDEDRLSYSVFGQGGQIRRSNASAFILNAQEVFEMMEAVRRDTRAELLHGRDRPRDRD